MSGDSQASTLQKTLERFSDFRPKILGLVVPSKKTAMGCEAEKACFYVAGNQALSVWAGLVPVIEYVRAYDVSVYMYG